MLDVLYYHYYQFYKRIIDISQPNLEAILALGLSCSFPLIFILQFVYVLINCELPNIWVCFIIAPIIALIIYKRYYETERYYNILQAKPLFFNNSIISKLITIFFFLASAGIFIFGMIYLHMVLQTGCMW